MNLASLFSLLLGYSLAAPPGPLNALIAAWSLRSFRHGFAVGAGAMSADNLLMLLTPALYGVSSALGRQFFAPFHAAGGLFFLYLAYKIGTAKPPREGTAGGGHPLKGYLLGLPLGLINPNQVAWWLTAGLGSIAHFGVEWAAGLFLAILTWIIAYPAAVGWGGVSTAA